ncbi:exocyst complex component EXO70A1-like [Senna tora]|uniref:Exocyst subunit Exo70 family protein n=1 Tax=Senna tora TaxID=362788 RepID=A0A834WCK5_9FABA|nr:exocyst complex component EXO70A1-like [Senna tora]
MGVEKLSKDGIQKLQWEILEAKIGNWIHFMRIAVKLLFAGEQKVCDQILEGFDSLSDQRLAELGKDLCYISQLALHKENAYLNDDLIYYQRLHMKFCRLKHCSKGKSCNEIREVALGLTKRLAQTAQETFRDFEEADEKDARKTVVADGDFDLGQDLFEEDQKVVEAAKQNLLLEDLEQILKCLSIQGLTSSGGGSGTAGGDGGTSSGASRAIVKDKFKTFNIMFEEIHQKQCHWTVPNTELRESLRLTVAEVLLPDYRSFVKRFGPLVENVKNSHKFIKYTTEDLERMLGEFFEGKSINETKR